MSLLFYLAFVLLLVLSILFSFPYVRFDFRGPCASLHVHCSAARSSAASSPLEAHVACIHTCTSYKALSGVEHGRRPSAGRSGRRSRALQDQVSGDPRFRENNVPRVDDTGVVYASPPPGRQWFGNPADSRRINRARTEATNEIKSRTDARIERLRRDDVNPRFQDFGNRGETTREPWGNDDVDPRFRENTENMNADNMAQRKELLKKMSRLFYNGANDMDPISHDEWNDLTIEELQTVVLLLDDDMVSLLNALEGTRGHCYLIETLYDYIQSTDRAVNIINNNPITHRQRQQIGDAYRAIHPEEEQTLEQLRQRLIELDWIILRLSVSGSNILLRQMLWRRLQGLPIEALELQVDQIRTQVQETKALRDRVQERINDMQGGSYCSIM